MRCPKCEYLVPEGATECPGCGVIFARYQKRQEARRRESDRQLSRHKTWSLPLKLSMLGVVLLLTAFGLQRFAAGFARGIGLHDAPEDFDETLTEPVDLGADVKDATLPPAFEEQPEDPEPPQLALPGRGVPSDWQPGMPVPDNWREVIGDLTEVVDASEEAVALASAGQAGEGIEKLEAALRRHPAELRETPSMRHLLAWLNLLAGREELEQGHPRAALAAFDRGLFASPESADLHADAAKACTTLREYERALEHVKQALAVQPGRKDLLSVET